MGRLRAARRVTLGFGLGALVGWLAGLMSKMKDTSTSSMERGS